MRGALIWGVLALALFLPLVAAGFSPLLAWREPVYIVAGFAGIVGLALMVMQPLLASGVLPSLDIYNARRVHRWVGAALVASIVLHVAGLWVTSPPDVVDALLFVSPTPFSAWGVVAMWAIFGAALLAALRRPLRLRWAQWRMGHVSLVAIAVAGTVVHALLIQGTMEIMTKVALCILAVAALVKGLLTLRAARASRSKAG